MPQYTSPILHYYTTPITHDAFMYVIRVSILMDPTTRTIAAEWCPGGAPVVSRRFPGCAQVVPRWCTGGTQVVSGCAQYHHKYTTAINNDTTTHVISVGINISFSIGIIATGA